MYKESAAHPSIVEAFLQPVSTTLGTWSPSREISGPITESISGILTQEFLYLNYIKQVSSKLQQTINEIQQLRDELSRRPLISSILIHDLSDDTYTLRLPISIILEETDEEALARWPETRIYGIGSTVFDAIFNLKREIIASFDDLQSRDKKSLGEIAFATFKIMEYHMRGKK